jgi:hypothetical protein
VAATLQESGAFTISRLGARLQRLGGEHERVGAARSPQLQRDREPELAGAWLNVPAVLGEQLTGGA